MGQFVHITLLVSFITVVLYKKVIAISSMGFYCIILRRPGCIKFVCVFLGIHLNIGVACVVWLLAFKCGLAAH